MELVSSSTATPTTTLPETADTVTPAQTANRLSLARTAVLGLVGTTAIVVGSVLGGQSFETHLPGAWFFGMPGGLFGSAGTTDSLPPVAALALVFGGLILLTRVWLGFLRHLNRHNGFPVKRVVLVVTIWAVPLLLAPPLFSRDVYTYAAQGEMMSHHINPYAYGPEVLGATPFNTMADTVWSGTESPYGPTFLSADGLLDQASGPPDPGRPRPPPPARGRRHRARSLRPLPRWPARSNATRPTPCFSARVRHWCSCLWSPVPTTKR